MLPLTVASTPEGHPFRFRHSQHCQGRPGAVPSVSGRSAVLSSQATSGRSPGNQSSPVAWWHCSPSVFQVAVAFRSNLFVWALDRKPNLAGTHRSRKTGPRVLERQPGGLSLRKTKAADAFAAMSARVERTIPVSKEPLGSPGRDAHCGRVRSKGQGRGARGVMPEGVLEEAAMSVYEP